MRARRGPSQKGSGRRPSKKLKCDQKKLAKADPKAPARTPSSGRSPPRRGTMLQSDAKGFPERNDEAARGRAVLCVEPSTLGTKGGLPKAAGRAVPQTHFREVEEEEEEEEEEELKEEEEEEIHGARLSEDSEMEPEDVDELAAEVDNSAFLNEDSNQPLPVDRFFGSVAFMQDLPAAPLTRAVASRREFRKGHFIAKEEEEEEDDEEGGL